MAKTEPCPIEPGQLDERSELRTQVLRVAEVAPFPRDSRDGGARTGFALDESSSGLCLQLEAPVVVGRLLRVTVRDFDGRTTREEIVRVAWCRARTGGRYNAGLQVVDESSDEALCVEHARRRSEVDVSKPD